MTEERETRMEIIRELVRLAHVGQFRANKTTPYYKHPFAVAEMVERWGGSDKAIVVAYSHDVKEDCPHEKIVLWEAIIRFVYEHEGADDIITMVDVLTVPKNLSREDKLRYMCAEIVAASEHFPELVLIKIADRLHNLSDMTGKTSEFISIYKTESLVLYEHLLPVARKNGWEEQLEEMKKIIA